jgi:hypothetical protein
MDRLTGKGAKSLKEAYAKVYEQPEVISESEVGFKNGGGNAAMQKYIKNGMSATQARMRVETDGAKYTLQQRAKEKETARVNRDRTIQQAGGGAAGEAEREKGKRAQYDKEFPQGTFKSSDERRRTSDGAISVDAKYRTRQTGEANLKRLGDGNLDKGIEVFRKQQAAKKAEAETKTPPVETKTPPVETKTPPVETKTPPASTPKPTQTYTVGGKTYSSKAEINKEYDRLRKSGGDAKAFGDKAFKATNKPAIGTTPGGTKFERRAPTSAELRAAQAARSAGKGEEGAIKAGVQQGQRQASVNASIKSANRPSVLNKQAPTGSALRAQQDRLAQKNKIQKEVAAVKSGIPANTQSSVNNTVKSSTVATGNTVKTKVNPDTSISVTQRRTPDATKKITQSLNLSQSVDLFDIVKGQFIEEGYSEEDTMYMMANLNEEQLQEFLKQLAGVAIRNAKKIPAVKGLVTKVGGMFNKAPTQMPSGQIGALRLRQGQATDAVNRLNQSTAASKVKDATRAATREKTRLNNLDPRAVSDRNAREASTQVRQRNMEMGRPSWYNPNNPGSKEALKRYYADKRAGVKGLPE